MSIGTAFGRIAGVNAAFSSKGTPALSGEAMTAINKGVGYAVA
jgi:hypothetical protein